MSAQEADSFCFNGLGQKLHKRYQDHDTGRKAKGEAEKTIRQAEGYALNRINRAQGDANKFLAIYNEYRQSKDVTRRRMYIETLNEILAKIDQKYFVDKDLKSILPMLQIDKQGGSK